ncbi:MAG: hypothetical protein ACK4YU_13865 [Paracoccus sp. (in: a-proteobacteria)]
MARDEQDDDRHVTEALAAMARQSRQEPVSPHLQELAQRLARKLAERDDEAPKD